MKPNPLHHARWAGALVLLAAIWLSGVGAESAAAAESAGIYSGALSGMEKGIWLMWLDADGKGRFMAWMDDSQLADAGTAAMAPDGTFSFTTNYGMQGSGSISAAGRTTGAFSVEGQSGSLEGLRQDGEKLRKLAGSHGGAFSGSAEGTWRFTVSPEGLISGSITTADNRLTESGEGLIDASGQFIFLTRQDTSLHGQLDSTGKASGEWNNPFWEIQGSLSDGRQVKAAKSTAPAAGSTGGSGGCFVDTLTRGRLP